jgi:hypothetical protein
MSDAPSYTYGQVQAMKEAWASRLAEVEARADALQREVERKDALLREAKRALEKSADKQFIARCLVAGMKSAGTYHAEVRALAPYLLSIAKRAAGELTHPARAALETRSEQGEG